MEPHIQSNNRTNWSSNREAVAQPKGLNYEQLLQSISNKNDLRNRPIPKESSVIRKDLRKDLRKTSSDSRISRDIDKADEVNKIDKDSIVPIPGLMFEYLENTDGYSGKSPNWTDNNNNMMSDGPQWGSYLGL